jgi:hypothetical protein
MTNYKQTSKNWGYYTLGKRKIGMTPNIAGNKQARVSYLLGTLGAENIENLQRYESRRLRYNLPLRPFNAGYRNSMEGRLEKPFGYNCSSQNDPENNLDLYALMEKNRRGQLPDWAWQDLSREY